MSSRRIFICPAAIEGVLPATVLLVIFLLAAGGARA